MKKLESKTVRELISLARQWGVSGYSKLKKAELVKLLAGKLPRGIKLELPGKSKSADRTRDARAASDDARTRAKTRPKDDSGAAAKSKGRQATQAGRAARAKASKARLGREGQEEYVRPEMKPVSAPVAAAARTPVAVPVAAQVVAGAALPARYGDGRMGLLPRDAHWLYCFWDLSSGQQQQLAASARSTLRVVRLGEPGDRQIQLIPLPPGASSWYVHVDDGDRTYRCDLGTLAPDGAFELVLSSNPSSTPPAGVSEIPAAAAFAPGPGAAGAGHQLPARSRPSAEQSRQLQRMSADEGGTGGLGSIGAQAGRQQRSVGGLASEELHSAAVSSFGAPAVQAGQRDFWLRMDADVILYGATVPGASVTLAGIPLSLDAQGHFRARFALPDGGHGFELLAASPDAVDRQRIQVQLDRRTEGPGRVG